MDETTHYYDKKTNQFSFIENNFIRLVEDGNVPDNLLPWQKDTIVQTRQFLDALDTGDGVVLYDAFTVNPYNFIKDFAHLKDDIDLIEAIRGKGAFPRFKNLISHKGYLEQ